MAAPGERELIPISALAIGPSCSQSQLVLAQQKSCESVSQAVLDMKGTVQQAEEQTEPEQSMAPEGEAAAPGGRELVPNSSRNSPGCIPSPFPSPLLHGDFGSYEHVYQGQACREQELSHLRVRSNQELSDCHNATSKSCP